MCRKTHFRAICSTENLSLHELHLFLIQARFAKQAQVRLYIRLGSQVRCEKDLTIKNW